MLLRRIFEKLGKGESLNPQEYADFVMLGDRLQSSVMNTENWDAGSGITEFDTLQVRRIVPRASSVLGLFSIAKQYHTSDFSTANGVAEPVVFNANGYGNNEFFQLDSTGQKI